MTKCRVCQKELLEFLDLGRMPLANGFLVESEFQSEYFYHLKTAFCPSCLMVQLIEQPAPDRMFTREYAYYSSISTIMEAHFHQLAQEIHSDYLIGKNPFVLELGSNDGILLRHFAAQGTRHLGVEPSRNVAEAARENGVNTICEFFDKNLAVRIQQEHGQAEVILAANVLCHISDIHSVFSGFQILLSDKGVIIFEDPYLGDILQKTAYDQIYDEHVFYFSLSSVQFLAQFHNMEVINVFPQQTHGGSMRYVLGRKGRHAVSPRVDEFRAREVGLGLQDFSVYEQFRRQVHRSRAFLVKQLNRLKQENRRVVGYGATSKSTTVIMFCGLGEQEIECIYDTTPGKQDTFTPGAHIPVRAFPDFYARYPDVALLFAWNHAEEIIAKEEEFSRQGGRWLMYVPEVRLL